LAKIGLLTERQIEKVVIISDMEEKLCKML